MGFIKNFLNKISGIIRGRQQALPEGSENSTTEGDSDSNNKNSFKSDLINKAKELSSEQLIEKFIRERIISKIDHQYAEDPNCI